MVVERIEVGDGYAAAHRVGIGGREGRVLIVPPFGVPAEVLGIVADDLANRGFEAITLDVRNHVGRGSGLMLDYRLSAVAEDCEAAIVRYRPTAVLGLSLGARALLRATSRLYASPTTVLMIPVVDLRSTLQAVIGEDVLTREKAPAVQRVLGRKVRTSSFIDDALLHDFFSPVGTQRDLLEHNGPVTLLPADQDPWIDLATVARVADGAGVDVVPVPCDQHELHKHPEMAMRMIGAAIDELVRAHRLASVAA